MIRNIASGPGLTVTSQPSLPYINPSSNGFDGLMRISGSDLQYFQNGTWCSFSSASTSIQLDIDTITLLGWVRTKKQQEEQRLKLAENNPALKKALDAIKRAEDNFDVIAKIAESEQA